MKGKVELRGGELGHCLDEDVGDDLVLDPVWVELVPEFCAEQTMVSRRSFVQQDDSNTVRH